MLILHIIFQHGRILDWPKKFNLLYLGTWSAIPAKCCNTDCSANWAGNCGLRKAFYFVLEFYMKPVLGKRTQVHHQATLERHNWTSKVGNNNISKTSPPPSQIIPYLFAFEPSKWLKWQLNQLAKCRWGWGPRAGPLKDDLKDDLKHGGGEREGKTK